MRVVCIDGMPDKFKEFKPRENYYGDDEIKEKPVLAFYKISDREWVENNMEICIWFLNQLEANEDFEVGC